MKQYIPSRSEMGYDNTKEYERPLFLNGHHIIKHTNDHFMQPKLEENYFQTEKQGLSSYEG